MTTPFSFPYTIVKDTPAIANEVQSNLDALLAWITTYYVQTDGSPDFTGPVVLPGDPQIDSQAANKGYVDRVRLVGEMIPYGGDNAPNLWLKCDGSIYTEQQYPKLYAIIGTKYNKSESNVPLGSFQVPDLQGRSVIGRDPTVAIFDTLGKRGGQRDSELQKHLHSVPSHGHGNNISGSITGGGHEHTQQGTFGSSEAGEHGHNFGNGTQVPYYQGPPGAYGFTLGALNWNSSGPWNGTGASGTYNPANAGRHSHSTTISGSTGGGGGHSHGWTKSGGVSDAAAFNTTETGAGTTLVDKNLQPYVVCNYLIYAGE